MNDFQRHALALAAQKNSSGWLASFREQAAGEWAALAWPTRKTEHWKYTSLNPLQKMLQAVFSTQLAPVADTIDFITLDATRLVFVNGIFDPALSSELPDEVVQFSQASSESQAIIRQHLGHVVEGSQHVFATLNNACVTEGIFVHLQAGQRLEKPLYVVHVSTGQDQPTLANQRLLVVLETSAQAEVIEHYLSTGETQQALVNALTEIVIGENAQLQHYRLNLEEEHTQHLGAVHVNLLRNARMRGFTLALGSQLTRVDYQINHRGTGAELDLQGVYLPRHQQMVDYHSNVQHWVGHCTTREVFRGIMADSSQAVFNGRIYIHPDAQKTLAELSNKNLLTSNKAEINTKPELEIYADDVKCAHGATVSQLNATALYYLQSRGVSRSEAEVMMSFGFINELLLQIAQPAVHDYLQPRLAQLFGRDQTLLAMAEE